MSSPCARMYSLCSTSRSAMRCRRWAAARPERWHAVDDVLDQVEPVHIVAHRHVEGRGGRALFLVAAHVEVAVVGPPVREPVNEPRIAVVREDDRPVRREDPVELAVAQPVRVLARGLELHQVDHVHHAHLELRQVLAQDGTAASISSVGTSPAQAITTSGSAPWSLLAHSQMPRPAVQCLTACVHREPLQRRLLAGDDDVHVVPLRRQWSVTESSVLASGGRYTRMMSAFLLTTWSMKPGSWWLKPLWSWRHTWDVSR